jgi:hypothetical protein
MRDVGASNDHASGLISAHGVKSYRIYMGHL